MKMTERKINLSTLLYNPLKSQREHKRGGVRYLRRFDCMVKGTIEYSILIKDDYGELK